MKKIVGVAAAALMTITATAGCGGDSSGSGGYCDDIKSAQSELGGLDGADFDAAKFDALTSAVKDIAAEAPDDIKGSWNLIADQFDTLETALADVGLTMDDFGDLTKGITPPSLDPADLQTLESKLQAFDDDGITAATDKIHDQVLADCDIELDSTSN